MDKTKNTHPHILFRKHWELTPQIQHWLGECEAMCRTIASSPIRPKDREFLMHVSLIKGAQATTAIEGNTLSQEEIEKIFEGESLAPSKHYQEIEVRNVIDTLNKIWMDVAFNKMSAPLSPALVQGFHRDITQNLGEHMDAIPGRWREDERTVGPYLPPRHQAVPELMKELCEWLKREFHYPDQDFTTGIVQAIVAHVYIEWIHPFGDGNGRTGRMVEFYILLRKGLPDIVSHILSNYYNETRSEYYRQLNETRKMRDLTGFIRYAVQGFRDGLVGNLEKIQEGQLKIFWRNHVYETFADLKYSKKSLFKRKRELVLAAPFDAWFGMDEAIYKTPLETIREYSKLSEMTKKRDFRNLVSMGLLMEKEGKYRINTDLLLQYLPVRK
ncbi:Fic family protein [Desulfococcaceae bacterium OttesenSCG-928-F15]|nr:Fic family protein [Desulfococcaceae bacterium OttesenSCG-928-F15]